MVREWSLVKLIKAISLCLARSRDYQGLLDTTMINPDPLEVNLGLDVAGIAPGGRAVDCSTKKACYVSHPSRQRSWELETQQRSLIVETKLQN